MWFVSLTASGFAAGVGLALLAQWWRTVTGRDLKGYKLRRKILGSYTPYVSLMSEGVLLAGCPGVTARWALRQLVREGYFLASTKPLPDGTMVYMRTDKQLS